MKVQNILNEAEQNKVGKFIEDEILFNAVKKVVLAYIYEQGTVKPGDEYDATTNFALTFAFREDISDEQMGRQLKISAEGIKLLEGSFETLKKYFKPMPAVEIKTEVNKAR